MSRISRLNDAIRLTSVTAFCRVREGPQRAGLKPLHPERFANGAKRTCRGELAHVRFDHGNRSVELLGERPEGPATDAARTSFPKCGRPQPPRPVRRFRPTGIADRPLKLLRKNHPNAGTFDIPIERR